MAHVRVLLAAVSVSLTIAAGQAQAATYYVSPGGSDAAAGTIAAPWRTVAKVNQAVLAPGDNVLFAGGGVWSETLQPRTSGTVAAPITFGAYGSGRPALDGAAAAGFAAVVVGARTDVVLRGLELRNWHAGHQAVYLAGSRRLLLDDLYIHDVDEGIHPTPSAPASDVTIEDTRIEHVGSATGGVAINLPDGGSGFVVRDTTISDVSDSCIIDKGAGSSYARMTVSHCGYNVLAYGTHGIYMKGPGQSLVDSDISDARSNCISVRFQDAVVAGNRAHGCPIGIAWFEYATAPGTVHITRNQIWNVETGIYLDGSQTQSFAIANNSILGSRVGGGQTLGINTRPVPSLAIENNVVSGNLSTTLAVDTAGHYVERGNVLHPLGHLTLGYRGSTVATLAAYQALSGQGAGDRTGDPAFTSVDPLRPNVALAATSQAIDAGVADTAAGTLTPGCDGAANHYCGAAPDAGASEATSAANGTTPPPAPVRDRTAPSTPGGLSAARMNNHTGYLVRWTPSRDNVAVVGYRVYVNGSALTRVAAAAARIATPAGGTRSVVTVIALDADGNESARSAPLTIVGPTAPRAPLVVAVHSTRLVVTAAHAAAGAVLVANGRRIVLGARRRLTIRGLRSRTPVRLYLEVKIGGASLRSATVVVTTR